MFDAPGSPAYVSKATHYKARNVALGFFTTTTRCRGNSVSKPNCSGRAQGQPESISACVGGVCGPDARTRPGLHYPGDQRSRLARAVALGLFADRALQSRTHSLRRTNPTTTSRKSSSERNCSIKPPPSVVGLLVVRAQGRPAGLASPRDEQLRRRAPLKVIRKFDNT